jgi:hypothetical protein
MQRMSHIVTLFLIIFFIPFDVQAYEEKVLTNVNTFKDEISKYDTVWVMYTFIAVKRGEYRENANKFWNLLKKEFGKQVDAYIVVDTSFWSKEDVMRTYDNEVGERRAPSFVLYKNGKVVNEGTDDDVRIVGAPTSEHRPLFIEEIKKVSFLK